jgi:uncharacterized RDD family membrane protein YckC
MEANAGQPGRSAEEISSSYEWTIVLFRWGATIVDAILVFGTLGLLFLIPDDQKSLQSLFLLLWGVLAVAYFPLLEHRYGATPGKLLCGLRVVDARGGRPSLNQAFVRTALRLIEVNPFMLGGIPAGIAVLASKSRQRLGDMAANTFVLRTVDLATPLRPPEVPPPATWSPPPPRPPAGDDPALRWVLPVGRSGWAIAAGYLGLFSLLVVPAPFALATGIIAVVRIRRDPKLHGMGRAVFGIVMGLLGTAGLIAAIWWNAVR